MDFQEMFFSFDGRLNRKPYILRFLLRNAIIWCLGYLIGSLFAPDGTMFQSLPLAASAVFTACSSPPQQGTSIRSSVTERMSFPRKMAVLKNCTVIPCPTR